MPDLQSMLDSFNSPPTRHAMFVHLPIVLTMVGALMALLAGILRRNTTLLVLAIGCQVALTIAVFATMNSGEHAEAAITAVLTPEVYDLIAEHEEMAQKMWMFAVGTILLLALSAALKNRAGTLCAWLAVLVAAGSVGWIGATANHGGELVYTYGVGTPQPVACFDIPGERSDGRDHAAEHAAAQNPTSQPATTQREAAGGDIALNPGMLDTADAVKVAFFRDEAFPILSEHCFNCHNPARVARDKSGRLDQTSLAGLLKGGRNGPAIVIGRPEDSLLMHRIRGDMPDDEIMPPDGKLPDRDIAVIERWIRDGAVWADPGAP